MFARRGAGAVGDDRALALDAMRAFVGASRISSNAVLEEIRAAIVRREPCFDVFLVFAPRGAELQCIVALGPRAEYYGELRLARDGTSLPALAAAASHRASGSEGVVVPTDRHALAVPIFDGDRLAAVVYVSSSVSGLVRNEDAIVAAIESAAVPFAIAVEREADRADATYDGLTGLLTPRAFRSRLAAEIERQRFGGSSILTLWFIDTDHFKTVNDTFGHAAGDVVLQIMANILRAAAIPGVDVVARNGGDEFCALIFDAQKTIAIERAQELCDAVRSADFGVPAHLSTSIGVATYPYDAHDSSELLEVADAAMYHSKRSGRDRVSFAVNGTSFSVYR